MADYTGIGAATATLRRILLERSRVLASVTTSPPDVEDTDADTPSANLFLYGASQNGSLRNQDLPGRTGPASLGQPPLSLDLRYLLTAVGHSPDDVAGAQEALGDAMLVLHDHPVVAKDDPLLDPDLAGEVELLKITLEDVDLDELSGLWNATSAPYRLAVGYRVSVVQLESTRPRHIAKPVGEPPEAGPRVYALPLDRPIITGVAVIRAQLDGTDGPERAQPHARVGDKLVIRGTGFVPGTRVRLGAADATAGVQAESTAERLVVAVPDDPGGQPRLWPGLQRVQLVRDAAVGDPERSLPVLESNVASFVLVPTVTDADAAVSGTPTPEEPAEVTVTVEGKRLAAPGTPALVLLGDRALTVEVAPAAFEPDDGSAEETSDITELSVDARLTAGSYPVRVRVAGAESVDADVEVVVS